MIPAPLKETPIHHLWRIVRLFGLTFGHTAWIGLLHLNNWPAKTAIIGVLVGATESAYRLAFPPGSQRLLAAFGGLVVKGLADVPPMSTGSEPATFGSSTIPPAPAAPAGGSSALIAQPGTAPGAPTITGEVL